MNRVMESFSRKGRKGRKEDGNVCDHPGSGGWNPEIGRIKRHGIEAVI